MDAKSKPALIYMLYDYEEHGPRDLRATTNKAAVPAMLAAWCEARSGTDSPVYDDQRAEAEANLAAALSEDGPGEHGLVRGWGGLTLLVIEQWTPSPTGEGA